MHAEGASIGVMEPEAQDANSARLVSRLRTIVGKRHVLTSATKKRRFSAGYRTGAGEAAAVVQPANLIEQWRVFCACISARYIVIVQAANTGLTGGSTPWGSYDRPVVIINTMRIKGVAPILGGEQVVCLSGSTLNDLSRKLAPLGREPHSEIGSSCLGASVIGGICNNSGGALVSRGPAFTQYALFARVSEGGKVLLCNRLGIELGSDPETILQNLEAGRYNEADILCDHRLASCRDYGEIVRDIDAPSPARFNADERRLFEASGSAGKVMVFAVRLDTFVRPEEVCTFYIGTNDPDELTAIRRNWLANCPTLPVSAEYIHRGAFDLAANYGKDMFLAIRLLGTDRLSLLEGLRNRIERLTSRMPFLRAGSFDRLLHRLARYLPEHLPRRVRDFHNRFDHHLILRASGEGIPFARALRNAALRDMEGEIFECDPDEAERAMLHRFVVAGAAVRFREINCRAAERLLSMDIALRRNDQAWFEALPESLSSAIAFKVYYGHFFCHVFHQDYLLVEGSPAAEIEAELHRLHDERGAEYPAEHNVGHCYAAKDTLQRHYRSLDPRNQLNPGIGKTSRNEAWR